MAQGRYCSWCQLLLPCHRDHCCLRPHVCCCSSYDTKICA
jgi:hypothetical protein